MLGHLTALSFSLSTGVPMQQLSPLWQFSEGETALLAPPTAELINEMAPEWMLKYSKELAVGFILIPILITKLTITHSLVQQRKAELEKQNTPNATPSPAAIRPETTVRAGAAAA